MIMNRVAVLFLAMLAAPAPWVVARADDYPTQIVVDYVIGCMASNGQTPDMLRRCSCSIDTIRSLMPYVAYEQAETVMRMQQALGDQAAIFRNSRVLRAKVDALRLAQVEADFRCF
jgi:hypothetical protein